jgi:hypothetical protein
MAQVSWGSTYNRTSTSFSIDVTVSSGGLGSHTPSILNVYAAPFLLGQCVGEQIKYADSGGQTKNVGYGTHTFHFSGLVAGTIYFIMAMTYAYGDSICYPLIGGGCCSFGNPANNWHQNWIEWNHSIPSVTTNTVTSITNNGAYFSGNVTYDGGRTVDSRGFDISLDPNALYNWVTVGSGTGNFGTTVTNLLPSTNYYYRAWGKNEVGWGVGTTYFFTTKGVPLLTTTAASAIEATTATAGGNVYNNGGDPITVRGLCWNTTGNPTTGNTHTSDGTGSGAFTSYMTSLSSNQLYYIRAYAFNSLVISYGNQLTFTTDTIPTVTTNTIVAVSTGIATGGGNVTNNGRGTVSARGMCWNYTGTPTIADFKTTNGSGTGAFTSTLTGLPSENTVIYGRAWATNLAGTAYGAEKTLVMFFAPTLSISSTGDKEVCLSWVNNSDNDGVEVWYRKESQSWILWTTTATGITSSCITGLSMDTDYTFEVHNTQGAASLVSNRVNTHTTVTFLQPFCESNTSYIVTGSTCGNADGAIVIGDEDYTVFYHFKLTDINGVVQSFTDYWWSGLTAGYYFVHATPKLEWWYHYGNDTCTEGWIAVEDSNTTLTLNNVKIKPANCQGFGSAKGRIVWLTADSSASTGWTLNVFNVKVQLVNTQNITSLAFIQYNCPPDIYYAVLENENGCTLLLPLAQVLAEKSWTVEGIQRLFLTPWDAAIGYNYYSTTDDDFYVAGLDTQQFTSSKIKEYIDVPDFWYEIKLNTAIVSYNQSLQNNQNGLTYQETVNVEIPSADNAKWKELVNVLNKRYIIVFQDNNGNWWTCFYRNGAEVKAYKRENNTYVLSFVHPSVSKLLTALDYDYIKLAIL